MKFLFVLILMGFTQTLEAQVQRPPQFVNLAFDGSRSPQMWQDTLRFAHNYDIKFTYFISSVYFISQAQRDIYIAPGLGPGRSAIGFGGSPSQISNRNGWLEQAASLGHEIAGHANGHFDGSGWSLSQWLYEISSFETFMIRAHDEYGGIRQPQRWQRLFQDQLIGFRAPQLGRNNSMYQALREQGYRYDTSRVARMNYWPQKDSQGLWNFPLAGLRMAYSGKNTLSMDYNMYVAQSNAERGDPALFEMWEGEVVETYLNYFRHNYFGNRAPVDIGHHFSLWNDGIYWNAMKRVAATVCHLPEVICGTYSDLVDFLEASTTAQIQAYQNGQFEKMPHTPLMPAAAVPARFGDEMSPELTPHELRQLERQACPPEAHKKTDEHHKVDI